VTIDDGGWGVPGEGRLSEQGSLRWYVETVWQRRRLVVLITLGCLVVAALYSLTASKLYSAQAQMLVTPVPTDQAAALGLGLITQGSDPTTEVTTASLLVDNATVAARVRRDLHLAAPPQTLLNEISVQPVANSSLISITASSSSPAVAQQLANGFATAAVQVRTEQLYQALDAAITNVQRRIVALGAAARSSVAAQPLYQQLAMLQSLRGGPDPELRLASAATLPVSPASPHVSVDLAAGLIAGLLVGIAASLVLNAIDPRKARERSIAATGLPVLARVPLLGRTPRLQPAFEEAFRSLRTMLRFTAGDGQIGSVAVTSASEKEGKTTASFQLAMAMLEAGQSVVLVEADPFRPALRALVEFEARPDGPGLLEYLSGDVDLVDAIETTSMPGLLFLSAGAQAPVSVTGLLEGELGRSLVPSLSLLADIVVLDCPPVGPRSDAIVLASYTDAVILVVDGRRSDHTTVTDVIGRLRRARARLLGIVLNRDASSGAAYDYREQVHKVTERGRALISGR